MWRHCNQWIVTLVLLIVCAGCRICSQVKSIDSQTLSLAGIWRFSMDRDDRGIEEQWYNLTLSDPITLPGALQSQGYGNPIDIDTPWVMTLYDQYWYLRKEFKDYAASEDVKVPFLSQPPRHYLGVAWYQRDIEIPENWQGRRMGLLLERTRWKTTVWIDANEIGSQDTLVSPHIFELGQTRPGRHRLTIRVDNRMQMDYRPDGHSVSDSLGSTWNGIAGRIELFNTTPVWLDDVQAFGDIQNKSVRLDIHIGNRTGRPGSGVIEVGHKREPVQWTEKGGDAQIVVDLSENTKLWSEFDPQLHHLTVTLKGEHAYDHRTIPFGLREISTDGYHLLVNGRKSHFRGTHSGGDFPLTGYPATDIEYWRNLFRTCKEWGLNHVRFHSFCPPEAAFDAADELGMYLQPEAGMWDAISPGSDMEKRMYEETNRMIRAYGNHPSFVLMSPSNEPKGRWQESLPQWVEYYRQRDPRRLYTTGTGWSLINRPGPVEGADFLAALRIGRRRIRGNIGWFGRDYLNSVRGVDVPVITHELGQWCAFPDFSVIDKFTGYLRPGNYEIYKDLMKDADLLDQNEAFAQASGRFQVACYKEEIEANLRTPGLTGFQLLDLHDYLGQGTALVGVLDPFWEPKGYVTAEQWRRFCNRTVPLAILKKRIFTTHDTFEVDLQIAHYGPSPILNATVYWQINNKQGHTLQNGHWPVEEISQGSAIALGQIKADLSALPSPEAYTLVVGLSETPFENDWNFWLYPTEPNMDTPDDIFVTRSFEQANNALSDGQKVLLMPLASQLQWNSPPIGREPIFWNRLMGPNWERFLGLVCDPQHPALAAFSTEFCYDWQWKAVFAPYSRAINLDSLPRNLQPIIQIIDDWNRNYKLGAVFECRVGKGKLMLCAADLESDLNNHPAAGQLRQSLLSYMTSDVFAPTVEITSEQLMQLYFDNFLMKKLKTIAHAAPDSGSDSIANVIDGNPNTYWTTAQRGSRNEHPYEFTLSFPAEVEMSGLVLMNRQDHRGHEGDIHAYAVEISPDGHAWSVLTKGRLESTFDPQTIAFGKKIATRCIKIKALSGFGKDSTASLAEVGILYAGPPLIAKTPESAAAYRKVASTTEEMDEAVDVLQYSSNPTAAHIERITMDSESESDRIEYALDGDPETIWHTPWQIVAPGHPHWLLLEFKEPLNVSGIRYLPHQVLSNGRIKDYHIEISSDGNKWQTVATGTFNASATEQTVKFAESTPTRFLKLTAESECQNQPFTSIAELVILND